MKNIFKTFIFAIGIIVFVLFPKHILAIENKPGQLVSHLFDIKNAPAVKSVAISPDGKEIWGALLNNPKRGVTVWSLATGEKITDINLNNNGGVEIIFLKDGSKAYVSQMETGQVFEIDAVTKKILRTFKTKSSWTKILELSGDGKKIYASNWLGNNVSEIDLAKGTLIRNIKTVKTPRGIYITPDGKFLYVAGYDKGEIEKINLIDSSRKTIFKGGSAMRHMAVDSDRNIIFISDMGKNTIWQLDLSTDTVKKFVSTDSHPNTIALSPDKKVLFVSCRGRNYSSTNYYRPGPDWGSVLLFDASSGKMLDAIVAGNQPTALAISPDGQTLVFSDFLDSKMEIFKVPAYTELLKGNGGRSNVYKKELIKKK